MPLTAEERRLVAAELTDVKARLIEITGAFERRVSALADQIGCPVPADRTQAGRTQDALRAADAAIIRLGAAEADATQTDADAQQAERVARWQAQDADAADTADAVVV